MRPRFRPGGRNVDARSLVCPACGTAYPGALPGARCELHDRFLIPAATRRAWPDDTMLGTMVAGRFALIDVLGVGGFGAVYRALQQPVGRVVALKLIHPRLDGLDQVRARFFREARVVAGLNDPTVVTLFDYGEQQDGMIFMAFELVEGVPLGELIQPGPMVPERAVRLLLQVLRALAVAHRRGLVHRDIKPANIMVRRDEFGQETVKVLDFGIAKIIQRSEGEEATLQTREGILLGTPRYMAPEQARGVDNVDARADLYAVGVIAYEMLSGRPPFAGTTPLEVVVAHVTQPPPPFDPGLRLPPALEQVVMRALAKHPDHRFESAAAFVDALMAAVPDARMGTGTLAWAPPDSRSVVLAVAPERTPNTGEITPVLTEERRFGWVLPLVVGAVLTAGAVGAWIGLRTPDSPPKPADATVRDARVVDAGPKPTDAAPVTRPVDASPASDAAAPTTAAPVTAAPPTAGPASPPTRRPKIIKGPASAPSTLEVPEF